MKFPWTDERVNSDVELSYEVVKYPDGSSYVKVNDLMD